jgi:hypothetical protein
MGNVLCDPRAEAVLARLREVESRQSPEMRQYYDAKRRAGAGPTNPGSADDMKFVRDNVRDFGGTGVVIGTEIEPTKADLARQNLSDAGLSEFVDIRVGDARKHCETPAARSTFCCSTAGSRWSGR